MTRRLKTIAGWINHQYSDELEAYTEKGHYNTDQKLRKDRWGTRIIIRSRSGEVLLDHNSADPYRRNSEVEDWLTQWLCDRAQPVIPE